ncbi:MAG: ATP synthase F1 subunit delta [Eubacteriales bacterium]
MAKLISKTYGEALFELAQEDDKIDLFMEEITGLQAVLEENAELDRLLNHPKIMKEEKIQVIETIFKNRIADEILGFLVLIIKKDRYKELNSILTYFVAQVKELKKIGIAYVTTAVTLTEVQKAEVINKLIETTSYETMEMHYQIDTALIGGMVIRIGDRVVDSSIATKLKDLQTNLLKIQLA